MIERERLDCALVRRRLVSSRHKAQDRILRGLVLVNGATAIKAGQWVTDADLLSLTEAERYVSRGGEKLEGALQHFKINVKGKNCLDVGSSTGGFTDCLLQHGAAHVTAIDVGQGQLAEKLRNHPQVTWHEKVNAREMTPEQWGNAFDLIVIDLSFISLKKVLPTIISLANSKTVLLPLVKPQFEVGKDAISKAGLVRDAAVRDSRIRDMVSFIQKELKWKMNGTVPCHLPGMDGNQEFFLCAQSSAV